MREMSRTYRQDAPSRLKPRQLKRLLAEAYLDTHALKSVLWVKR